MSGEKMETQRQPQALTRVETLSPQRAVQEYLDALLLDATTRAREVTVPAPAQPALKVEVPTPDPVPVVTPAPRVAPEAPSEPETGRWIDGRPAWAQRKFECLLFRVAGLTLAVPLVELGGVLTLDKELTPLFGQPEWFLGLLPSKSEGTVKAIDTARWVMPERYDPETRKNFKYVILMQGSDWGMACHEVMDAITLEPEQVSWRSDRGRRPWLAGTVIEQMCAIMDVSALVRLVDKDSHRGGVAGPKA